MFNIQVAGQTEYILLPGNFCTEDKSQPLASAKSLVFMKLAETYHLSDPESSV